MKQKFKVEGNGQIRGNWNDDDSWTKIYLERELKEIIQWA